MILNRRDFIKALTTGGAMPALDPFLFAQRYGESLPLLACHTISGNGTCRENPE